MTQRQLAERIGRPPQFVSLLCRGRAPITAGTALALERALDGVSAEFWIRLQADYELARARLEAAAAG
jgi:addiction module HigA family antidote